jgi:hypothetical protein
MTDRVRRTSVQLTACEAIQLESALTLPAGVYTGEKKELGIALMDGHIQWTRPAYIIEFSAEELASMGMSDTGQLISVEYDVTKFVRLGQLRASE